MKMNCWNNKLKRYELIDFGTNIVDEFEIDIELNGLHFLFRTQDEAINVAKLIKDKILKLRQCQECVYDIGFGYCTKDGCDEFNNGFAKKRYK